MVRSASARAEGSARPDRATVVPIADAAVRRYDRLRDMLLRVAEDDFHVGRHGHCRYWLDYLRQARPMTRIAERREVA